MESRMQPRVNVLNRVRTINRMARKNTKSETVARQLDAELVRIEPMIAKAEDAVSRGY